MSGPHIYNEEANFWLTLKDFASLVDDAVVRKLPGVRPDLESGLKKQKQTFTKLLRNPCRSAKDLELVRKSSTEGISTAVLATDGRKVPQTVVQEALIIADMFELNETVALQLIVQGEERLCDHPGLTRGLVAVLIYFDTRKTIVDTLKTLILGCRGATWTLETSDDIADLVTDFTKDLVKENLVLNILSLLKSLNWQSEMTRLQKNMALGDAKHRSQVEELFRGIKKGLAECLFALAAQLGLSTPDTIHLIDALAKIKLEDSNADCSLDEVDVALVMALLYALDISKVQDGVTLPIIEDPTAVPTLHKELFQTSNREWNHEGISSLVRFAWAMTLANMRSQSVTSRPEVQGIIDDDELVLESALNSGTFHWLSKCILLSKCISQEEFYLRRMHQLLTDVIVSMPLKVKELRNRADDAARNKLMHEQEGIQFNVPLQGQHFEQLLCSIAKLYNDIEDPTHLDLLLDFWCPIETSASGIERYPSRQISLYKFLRLAGDLLMPSLYTPYVEMLASLSRHPQASLHCFNLLKLNGLGNNQGGGTSSISWDHFFNSLNQYFVNLRQETQIASTDTIYRLRTMNKGISPSEIQGLAAVLKLITVVSTYSEPARLAFAQRPEWQPVLVMIGLLGCSVPSMLKAEILKTLTSLSKTPEVALDIWNALEASNFITVSGSNSLQKGGFILELETVETKTEDYSMTMAFLELLNGLIDNYPFIMGSNAKSAETFESFNYLLVDDIFLHFYNKGYKNPAQKWEICEASLKIICRLLTDDNLIGDGLVQGKMVGSRVLTYLNQPSELLRLLLHILDEGCSAIESCVKFPGKRSVEQCCLYVLKILQRGLELQPNLLKAARDANSSTVYSGLDKMLLGINARTGKADHMLTVAKFISFFGSLPLHTIQAVKLITAISNPANQTSLLAEFNVTDVLGKSIVKGTTDIMDTASVDCETSDEEHFERTARLAVVDLFQKCSHFPAPNLVHFFLGFDLNNIAKSNIKPPTAIGSVRSPFHAMIACMQSNDFILRAPYSAEAVLKLVYTLCSNAETSGPILRYLHSSDHFFINQLSLLPLHMNKVEVVRAQSWLMKASAVQLKSICNTRLRSQVTNWINLLLSPTRNILSSSIQDDYSDVDLNQLSHINLKKSESRQAHNRLLTILNALAFDDRSAESPSLEIFDTELIKGVLAKCRTVGMGDNSGVMLIDIPGKLHAILRQEIAAISGSTGMNQRQMIRDEVDAILRYALQLNAVLIETEARKSYLDAWRQITEVIFCCTPTEILSNATRQQILLELLQTLLNKVHSEGASAELTSPVSGIVLLLLTALRHTYLTGKAKDQKADGYVPILDASTQMFTKKSMVYPTALQVVLKGLVVWISGTSKQITITI